MTAILALETATGMVGCAVGTAGGSSVDIAHSQTMNTDAGSGSTNDNQPGVRAAIVAHSERSHGEMLAPMIQAVLAETELSIDDIGLVAVDCGPGRYTGLRVGIATAAALAYARSLPVVAVGSTELLAFGARKFCGNIVPVVDARRGEAFFAVYKSTGDNSNGDKGTGGKSNADKSNADKSNGDKGNEDKGKADKSSGDKSTGDSLTEISPVSIATPSQLKQRLLQLEDPSLILGDFAFDSLDFATDSSTRISAHYCENRPSPSSLVILAAQKAAAGKVLEPSELRPLYLRRPDINTAGRSKRKPQSQTANTLTGRKLSPSRK